MKYRLTCLTPVLVGNGQKLSPVDYMVWRNQVNVLDQRRIFRLLARGPRLEGYLAQLRRAEKLDFASWGGFAQNFADRRVPFEHAAAAACWERAKGESLQIPVFASGPDGPYLPGSALKGALRTGLLFAAWKDDMPARLEALEAERMMRRPGETLEQQALGGPGSSLMRAVRISDSRPVPVAALKVYMLRVATLQARAGGQYELGWKQAPRGTVDARRVEESTPLFAEMAAPGTVFEGEWREHSYLNQPGIWEALGWKGPLDTAGILRMVNEYAEQLLEQHRQYARRAGLPLVLRSLEEVASRLPANGRMACLLAIGWGSGLLAKSGFMDTDSEAYRRAMAQSPLYARAIHAGLPFPKTRRIVFLNNQPAALPGWALLELG
ncbi:MAG: type III-A CRISPR-associated RAMP protein Csm5 [Bryobacterales bacterium]|nr:type III-A CRISPR-associated RAMP protein Csm5 [Bryobacteraceae bacterium]MDW8130168.1 type III-A CRISPR-associated RAMP protein Csm5 [Bryobacterales bacterium]